MDALKHGANWSPVCLSGLYVFQAGPVFSCFICHQGVRQHCDGNASSVFWMNRSAGSWRSPLIHHWWLMAAQPNSLCVSSSFSLILLWSGSNVEATILLPGTMYSRLIYSNNLLRPLPSTKLSGRMSWAAMRRWAELVFLNDQDHIVYVLRRLTMLVWRFNVHRPVLNVFYTHCSILVVVPDYS